jgi:hypothetical protein
MAFPVCLFFVRLPTDGAGSSLPPLLSRIVEDADMTLRTLQKSIDFEALGLKPRGCVAYVRAGLVSAFICRCDGGDCGKSGGFPERIEKAFD